MPAPAFSGPARPQVDGVAFFAVQLLQFLTGDCPGMWWQSLADIGQIALVQGLFCCPQGFPLIVTGP
ncbi:hypothetical protein LP52_15560 [Streptomonospora alba]|uniref:Uncharacterized protein n=1 Tax=Streptomonospora alba TaxID=183763 RepID=A0A0C2FFS6_9ACTN|nr:hypothetical protein LP52_15560 [Streptomonospora alba]